MTEINFFVRLLSYEEAINVIDEIKKIGGYGNITAGGLSLTGNQSQFDKIINYMEQNCRRFEFTKTHPSTVNKSIGLKATNEK